MAGVDAQEEMRDLANGYFHLLERLNYYDPKDEDMRNSAEVIRSEMGSLEARAKKLFVDMNGEVIAEEHAESR